MKLLYILIVLLVSTAGIGEELPDGFCRPNENYISNLLSTAQPGDVITVPAGVYYDGIELDTVGELGSYIKIIGEDPDNTFILGGTLIIPDHLILYSNNTYYIDNVPGDIEGVACNQGYLYSPVEARTYVTDEVQLEEMLYNTKWRSFANNQKSEDNPINSLQDCLDTPGSFYVDGDRLYIHFPYIMDDPDNLVVYYYSHPFDRGFNFEYCESIWVENFTILGHSGGVKGYRTNDIVIKNINTYGNHNAILGTEPNGSGVHLIRCDDAIIENIKIGNGNQIGTERSAHNTYGPSCMVTDLCNRVNITYASIWEGQNTGGADGTKDYYLGYSRWYDNYNHGLTFHRDGDTPTENVIIEHCVGGFYCQEGVRFDHVENFTIRYSTLSSIACILDRPDDHGHNITLHHNLLRAYSLAADDIGNIISEWTTYENMFTGDPFDNFEVIGRDVPGCGRTLKCLQEFGLEQHSRMVHVSFYD